MVRTVSLLLLVLGISTIANAEEWIGGPDWYVQTALDNQGNLHVVFVDPSMEVFHKKYDGSTWTDSVYLANSTGCWLLYTYPAIDIGPDGLPHIVYGTDTGNYPHDLNYFTYAHAVTQVCTSWTYQTIGNDGLRRGMADIAVDDSNQPHMVYQTTNKWSPWWYKITYRDPSGTEHTIREVWDPQQVSRPRIAYGNGTIHITWYETGSNRTNIWYAASPSFMPQQVSSVGYGHNVESPGIGVATDGTVGIVYLVANWNGSPYYTGLFYTQPGWSDGIQLTGAAALSEQFEDFWPPNIAFHANGDRYISWYHWAENEHYYMGPSGTTVFYPRGHIDVCAGVAGAYYVRCGGNPGPMYFDQIAGGGANTPPTIAILSPPGTNAEADLSYTITWEDTDPDDNATISLYYDTNNSGYNGTLIPGAGSIAEDPDAFGDQYSWDLSGLNDDSIYWVYGIIDDGTNPPASDYSPGWLRVNHENDPPWIQLTAPAAQDTAEGTYYTITWNDGDPDDDAQIALYYYPEDLTDNLTLIVDGLTENNETDEFPWDLSMLDPGTYGVYATITDGASTDDDHAPGSVTKLLTLTFSPTDDASVYRDWQPGLPHGNLPDLDYGADDLSVPDEMAFFKFVVSNLEYGIIRAYLKVYCVDEGGGGGVHSVASTDWTEDDLTWNNMPGIGLTPVSEITWVYANAWYTYEVTDLLLGEGTYAMVLRSTEPNGAHVASKENLNQAIRPYLELHVGGEPPTFPPTAQIDDIDPNPVIQGYHSEVNFHGSAWDNDEGGESIELWRWISDFDGIIGSTADVTLDPMTLSVGIHQILFRVRDNEGDWSVPDTASMQVKPPDTTGPTWPNGIGLQVLVNPGTGGKLEASWNVASDVNPPITYNLYYNTASPAFDGTMIEDVNWVSGEDFDCNYLMTGIVNGQIYFVGVRAVDMVGNEDTNEVELSATPSDITPPSFSSGPNAVDITATSARIVWATGESATSAVGYWITPEESLSVEDPSLVTSHSVQLAGLTPGIVYFYRAYSSDAAGNEAMSGIESFQTAAGPVYSYLPTDDAYVVSWEPDENFGTSTRLIVETYEISYLRFEVPEQQDIASARIQIFCAVSGDSAEVWSVSNTGWDEETLNWNNRPEIDGPWAGGIHTPSAGQMYSIDVSEVVIAEGSWAFAMTGPARDVCQFISKEHTAEAERPYLVVEFATDTEAPAQVTGVACSASGSNDLYFEWSSSSDNVGVAGYRVYRSTEPFFTLAPRHIIATVQTTDYTDADILGNPDIEHYYAITAYDEAGNESERSDTVGESEFSTGVSTE